MNPAAWVAALEASTLGQWMRGDAWAYPVVNVLHLFGLTLLVGPIVLLDLRLLGAGRAFPLAATSRVLTAWAIAGLLVLLPSGSALFAADAGALLANPAMRFKLIAITLALTNAIAFRWLWSSHIAHWDQAPPPLGRLQALLSIVLWLAIPVAGRMIAYV